LICYVCISNFCIVGVLLFTLLERKVWVIFRSRKGPNKYEFYSMMLAGRSSNSNYALLGGLRAVAQTISYEVSIALILLRFIILVVLGLIYFLFISYMFGFFVTETNRTPFDFSEGESELGSGFNVEYRRGGFALIFMAEYSRIFL
ncbi:LOW QUALITY PROTEIN: NADH-ubiquinone oxidoreductase chain 1, partial [Gryllus bimaculatus]